HRRRRSASQARSFGIARRVDRGARSASLRKALTGPAPLPEALTGKSHSIRGLVCGGTGEEPRAGWPGRALQEARVPSRSTRVIIRIVKSPVAERGQILVVLPESRAVHTQEVLAYLLDGSAIQLRIEKLRRLMDRTRKADPHTAAEAKRQFE